MQIHLLTNRILRADNCGNQHECRQNFVQLHINSRNHHCTCAYKFVSTSKSMKNETNKLELKLSRVADVHDCCRQLNPTLTKNTTQKWQSLMSSRSPSMFPKPRGQRTACVLCGTEDEDECNALEPNCDQVFFVNRNDVPDIHPSPSTQQTHQITLEQNLNSFLCSNLP